MKKIKLNHLIYFIAAISIIILGMSAYKAKQSHENKLYLVLHKKIKERALECYLKQECEGKITLGDLYQKNYLDELFDPVTKEKMDNNICIEYINEEVYFC
ncbi:MAG: hypothetical protein GX265_05960 [Mollicutes bacterium]|jgi:hypothetical protein|nr:hypothetical protein [Mollicutes bacterium]